MAGRGTGQVASKRYRIVVRGEFGDLLSGAFEDLSIDTADGTTVLHAVVLDEQALYGILDRLRDFALHIISIQDLGAAGGGNHSSST